ncbi:uncharacterized protein BP5553_00044 [Venustampulla echinocandica]|uniref:NAD(P)-binding domain-containing protein n=1 Tax=Venustampulla echinocandica TaxID=2656787 RepID=A0A370TX09_9HELO|nr:uncharacterized protein BP5553_00044 [Venustampulla echinocandica]RDL40065.1 hypothetical protein BP5553_00044 [Venustampulla echinocandica]
MYFDEVDKGMAGGTGHIGGAVLDGIYGYPGWTSLTVLVRGDAKAQRLQARYPKISVLVGDIDNVEIVEAAAKDADIVINCCPDISHEEGISAILRGLASREVKGFYFHTSGAALIWDEPDGSKAGTKVWDDIEDIGVITSLPEDKSHRKTDKLVFVASEDVNVAIISPTMVCGLSQSIEHPFPLTLPSILKVIRSLNSGFTVSAGENRLSYIHVQDLASLYFTLACHALRYIAYEVGSTNDDPKEIVSYCGPKAYYFAEFGDTSFGSYMADMVRELNFLGVLENIEVKRIDLRDAEQASGAMEDDAPDSWAKHIAASYGIDMRVKASRAKKLGWDPRVKNLQHDLGEVLKKYSESEKGV